MKTLEPLATNAEWHRYLVGQGGELVTRYKGCDIHRAGISHYVNGFWVGTSLRRAKAYINASLPGRVD